METGPAIRHTALISLLIAMRTQSYCSICRKPTLHELDPRTVNHVLHLIISLFCCGFWVPVWILLAMTAPRRFVRCLTCGAIEGQGEGRIAGEFVVPVVTDRARADAYLAANEARFEKRVAAEQRAEARSQAIRSFTERCRDQAAALKAAVLAAVAQVDQFILRVAAGDAFLAMIYRALAIGSMVACGAIGLYLTGAAIVWLIG